MSRNRKSLGAVGVVVLIGLVVAGCAGKSPRYRENSPMEIASARLVLEQIKEGLSRSYPTGAAQFDMGELDEGCAHGDSVLLAFQQQFWAPYGDAAPDLANTDADLAWEFYLAHEDDFVSDYAATNAIEDAAETFMTFVLEDEPTGDSMVARKLEFFWGYPELVAIRERIRTEFADDLGLVG